MITVFELGSNVFIGLFREPVAVVTGVAIYNQSRVQYQVLWWDGLTRHLVMN